MDPLSITPQSLDFLSTSTSLQPNTNFDASASAGNGGVFGSGLTPGQFGLGVVDGLKTIGGLWQAFQAQKLAKKQFSFLKDITETNLANQIKSYNTTLADRARSRAFTEGQSSAEMQAYIDKNSLSRSEHPNHS